MARGVRWLLVAAGLVLVIAVAATAFVVLRSGRPASPPPAAPEAAVPEPEAVAEVEAPSPAPPVRTVPRRTVRRPKPAPEPEAAEDESAGDPGEKPKEAAQETDQERRERRARQWVEEKAARELSRLSERLKLTAEQSEAAQSAIESLGGAFRDIARLQMRQRVDRAEVLRRAEEQGLTGEQKQALVADSEARLRMETRAETITACDGAMAALRLLRLHLGADQVGSLDKAVEEIQEEKDRSLQGAATGR